MNASQISGKNVVGNFTAFDLIDNDVNDIVLAVFSYFFKDLNVLPAVLFTIAYRLSNSSYFKLVLGLFQIYSEKLLTRTAA